MLEISECEIARVNCTFLTDQSKAVPLLQFFFVISHVVFVISLFVPHLSFFGASGRLCFVIVAFPGYLKLYFASDQTGLSAGY